MRQRLRSIPVNAETARSTALDCSAQGSLAGDLPSIGISFLRWELPKEVQSEGIWDKILPEESFADHPFTVLAFKIPWVKSLTAPLGFTSVFSSGTEF